MPGSVDGTQTRASNSFRPPYCVRTMMYATSVNADMQISALPPATMSVLMVALMIPGLVNAICQCLNVHGSAMLK